MVSELWGGFRKNWRMIVSLVAFAGVATTVGVVAIYYTEKADERQREENVIECDRIGGEMTNFNSKVQCRVDGTVVATWWDGE